MGAFFHWCVCFRKVTLSFEGFKLRLRFRISWKLDTRRGCGARLTWICTVRSLKSQACKKAFSTFDSDSVWSGLREKEQNMWELWGVMFVCCLFWLYDVRFMALC